MRAVKTLLVGSAFLLYLAVSPAAVSAEWNILGTWLEPENPTPGVDTVVYVELASTENVTWIRVVQCTLAPYVCFSPNYIQSPTSSISSVVLREVDPGMSVGWNVTVLYDNGTQEQSPALGNAYPGQETVSPIPEALYFKYVMGGEPQDGDGKSTPGFEAAVTVAVVLAAAVAVSRIRRREG
jgi:PGF-CTERM protein